jgi:hypothetical protein
MICFDMMLILRIAALLLWILPVAALAERVTITADQWATPRSGAEVAHFGALDTLIAAFDEQPSAQVVIHYGPGETGSLWAEELRSWLVALGVPSARITLSASLVRRDIIQIETQPKQGTP